MNSDHLHDEMPCEHRGCENVAYAPWCYCPVHGGRARNWTAGERQP